MSTIIKAHAATEQRPGVGAVAFNFDDMTGKATAYLAQVKAEAAKIVAQAQQEAAQIRKQAQEQGNKTAVDAAEKSVQSRIDTQLRQQLKSALPALEQLVKSLAAERLQWRQKWEENAVKLALAIAEKVIRRELSQQPTITLALVREALELASGCHSIQVRLNPQDYAALGKEIAELAKLIGGAAPATIAADAQVTSGGCLVQTEFGSIDEQIESQLARIAEELF